MVRPQEIAEAVRRGIENSGRLPAEMSYLTRTPDTQGEDAHITYPACVITQVSVTRDEDRSTDLVGYHRNAQGQAIGRIFDMTFQQELQVDVYTAAGSSWNVNDLMDSVERALWRYDSQLRHDLLPAEDGSGISEVWSFTLGQRRPADNLAKSPSERRIMKSVFTGFTIRVDEVEEYGPLPTISEIITADWDDYEGLPGDGDELEYYPPP